MAQAGWTEQQIKDCVQGIPAGLSFDQRRAGKTSDGIKINDPATVYRSEDGGCVVVNDGTHEVAAIADKNAPSFIDDSRILWYYK